MLEYGMETYNIRRISHNKQYDKMSTPITSPENNIGLFAANSTSQLETYLAATRPISLYHIEVSIIEFTGLVPQLTTFYLINKVMLIRIELDQKKTVFVVFDERTLTIRLLPRELQKKIIKHKLYGGLKGGGLGNTLQKIIVIFLSIKTHTAANVHKRYVSDEYLGMCGNLPSFLPTNKQTNYPIGMVKNEGYYRDLPLPCIEDNNIFFNEETCDLEKKLYVPITNEARGQINTLRTAIAIQEISISLDYAISTSNIDLTKLIEYIMRIKSLFSISKIIQNSQRGQCGEFVILGQKDMFERWLSHRQDLNLYVVTIIYALDPTISSWGSGNNHAFLATMPESEEFSVVVEGNTAKFPANSFICDPWNGVAGVPDSKKPDMTLYHNGIVDVQIKLALSWNDHTAEICLAKFFGTLDELPISIKEVFLYELRIIIGEDLFQIALENYLPITKQEFLNNYEEL